MKYLQNDFRTRWVSDRHFTAYCRVMTMFGSICPVVIGLVTPTFTDSFRHDPLAWKAALKQDPLCFQMFLILSPEGDEHNGHQHKDHDKEWNFHFGHIKGVSSGVITAGIAKGWSIWVALPLTITHVYICASAPGIPWKANGAAKLRSEYWHGIAVPPSFMECDGIQCSLRIWFWTDWIRGDRVRCQSILISDVASKYWIGWRGWSDRISRWNWYKSLKWDAMMRTRNTVKT